MKHHNFVICKNDNPEQKIKQELDFLRNENKGFKLLHGWIMSNFTDTESTLVTVEYSHD